MAEDPFAAPHVDGLAWHHTDGPGLLAVLATQTLWATAAPFLNDREEVRLGGRLVVERLLEAAAEHDSAFAGEIAARVAGSTERGEGPGPGSAFILSASSSPDSLAMWRLYGGAAESYAIGLDPGVPLAALASAEVDASLLGGRSGLFLSHYGWQPVRYRPEDQRALVDTALAQLGDIVEALGPDALSRAPDARPGEGPELPEHVVALVGPFLEALQEVLLLVKHEGFADERETRYSVLLAAGDGDDARQAQARLLSYRASAYGIAPYLRLTGRGPDGSAVTTSASLLPIRAVAMSPSPNGPEAADSVRTVLLAHGHDVPVLRSTIPFRG